MSASTASMSSKVSEISKTVSKNISDQAVDVAKGSARDFDPMEILKSGIFGDNDPASNVEDFLADGITGFGKKLLMALIPSPETVGASLAIYTGVMHKEALKEFGEDAEESGLMDQIQSAKARGRRASSTAKKCASPTCNTFHFRIEAYCVEHKHLSQRPASVAGKSTMSILKENPNIENARPDLLKHLKAIELRQKMLTRAETYDVELTVDLVPEAKTLLQGKLSPRVQVHDVELGQLLQQFKRLDIDADGIFSVGDFTTWVYRIDPDFKGAADGTVNEWLRQSTTDGTEQFDFAGYVQMVLARRDLEDSNWGQPVEVIVPVEFKQTPFWDLRTLALHAQFQPRADWMLKRGYLCTMESLNAWKLRYVRTHAVRTYEPPVLEYWDADPNVEVLPVVEGQPAQVFPVRRGAINLSEIVLVDFSPKTPTPRGTDAKLKEQQEKVGMAPDTEMVLKITLLNGRRYTLACEEDKAISWAAELSRHAAASRLTIDWRENWGTKRVGKIVLRDWVNAAVVIAKIGQQKNALLDAKKMVEAASKKWTILPGGKAAAMKKAQRDASDYIKQLVLNDRDKMMLRVVGLTDQTVDQLGGAVLVGIRLWNATKDQLKYLDNQITQGGVQYGVTAAVNAVNLYNYARVAKNAYNANKWKVEWEPKSMQRACNVCFTTFKSLTMRKTMGKHHCRSCGKVVCHVCAANRIYMPLSEKFERVCTKCITENGHKLSVGADGLPIPPAPINSPEKDEDSSDEDEA